MMHGLPIYKAVLFDMDGVVVDTMTYHFRAWEILFNSLGINIDSIEIYRREGEKGIKTLRGILNAHDKRLDDDRLLYLLSEKERIFKEIVRTELIPGVQDLIDFLQCKSIPVGLVSGTSRDEIMHILPAPLIRRFRVIVSGDSVKRGKPDPEPYCKAIEALDVDPSSVIVVENAPYGIESAKRAGAFCIAVTTSLSREYLKDADVICDRIDDVLRLFCGEGL